MCASREPRRFNGLCGTCSELGHLSCYCLLHHDRIYFDVPTLVFPLQINRSGRGGTGYDLPMSPPSYSGRSGGTGCDIPRSPLQYSGSNNGYGTNGGPQQHEAKMSRAREPRRFNGLCGTCSELGPLSYHCLLRRDRIYSGVPTLFSPPQINRSGRGGTGYDLPMSPPSYSGRSGGTGYNIPWSPPQFSGSNNGYGSNGGPQQQYGRGADGSAGYGAIFTQQQPAPRPFRSFGWDQRYACRNGPPVTGGLSKSIAQGQAQRDVGVDDQEEGQRPSTEVEYHGGPLSEVFGPPKSVEQQRATAEMDCHGGPVTELFGPPEATASLARGGLPLQARHQRQLQPPSGTLSPPTAVISDSAFEEWLQSDDMKMPMFSLSERQRQQPPKHTTISTAEGPQLSAPTAVALATAAPAAAAVIGTRAFSAVSSKGVAEAPASSAGAASAAVPAAASATGGTVFPLRR